MNREDISNGLISDGDVRKHLSVMFPDAIVLDDQLKIVSLSEATAGVLGYRLAELVGKELRLLFGDDVTRQISSALRKGIFSNYIATFQSKSGDMITGDRKSTRLNSSHGY